MTNLSIHAGNLILVNANYALQPQEKSLVAIDENHAEILVSKAFYNAYHKTLQTIGNPKTIVPVSGYRSHEEQINLFNSSLKENGKEFTYQYVALPDHSEHQTGLALDVGIDAEHIDFIRPDFPYTGIAQAFRQEAIHHGLIERYTKDKEDITGISQEPWHFRYVGIPHAEYMATHDLCLEEYIARLHNYTAQNPLYYHGYVIYYCQSIPQEINKTQDISGNNIDGFIITQTL